MKFTARDMMNAKISPSMMCADPAALTRTLNVFEQAKIEYLHIDVMDGVFVPNFTLGTDYCRQLKKMTDIPLDIHLMITDPAEKTAWFPAGPGDIVSVHYESAADIRPALENIKKTGARAFLAVNPATPAEVMIPCADVLDGVLVMCVNPGFAGQKLIESTIGKITQVRGILDAAGRTDASVEVDGNVSFDNAVRMRAAGADIFVGGSSGVFCPSMSLKDAIDLFGEKIGRALP